VLATEWGKYGITVNSIAPTVFHSRARLYADIISVIETARRKSINPLDAIKMTSKDSK
jgi:NAD(P)-dependent dehydrogenase (short-subunit alcohol dehydrogenase family)